MIMMMMILMSRETTKATPAGRKGRPHTHELGGGLPHDCALPLHAGARGAMRRPLHARHHAPCCPDNNTTSSVHAPLQRGSPYPLRHQRRCPLTSPMRSPPRTPRQIRHPSRHGGLPPPHPRHSCALTVPIGELAGWWVVATDGDWPGLGGCILHRFWS